MSKSYILAIDTSCDDSSAAVVAERTVYSNIIASQNHQQYGGVFPTVAKAEHKKNLQPVIEEALATAGVTWNELAAVAVTQGPGLAPALEVGITVAKQLAVEHQLPLIAVNHLAGHALSPLAKPALQSAEPADHSFAAEISELEFPFLSIVVSGGHTEFILVNSIGEYQRLGFTVDDAAGEALDKFGRLIGLPYPAGPAIEAFASRGNPHKYEFPLPMTTSGNFNLSFAGLKTSAKNSVEKMTQTNSAATPLTDQQKIDLCASFQFAVFRAITYKLKKIQTEYHFSTIFLGGGVACNLALRAAITEATGLPLFVPYSKKLCVDNAAMIGLVAGWQLAAGQLLNTPDQIAKIERLPDWEIDLD